MTWTPNPPFGAGGNITATTSTALADLGKDGSNTGRTQMAVQPHMTQHLNVLNVGTVVPVAKN